MEYQEQSLGGQIFNRIRDDILSGNYTPGEELKEATLGKQLGVSRTPVREALRQLDLEGLVEIAPNRGAKVIGISRKDVEDIYHMRARLEGLAARKAAEQIKEEELAELEEVILLSEFHVKKPESKQMVRLDGRFHEIIPGIGKPDARTRADRFSSLCENGALPFRKNRTPCAGIRERT